MSSPVPRIVLQNYTHGTDAQREAFVQTLGKGFEEVGFLTVGGHNLDPDTTERAYAAYRKFFDLPTAVKERYDCVEGGARGYTPLGREHAKDNPLPDLKEFWHVGQELPAGHAYRAEYADNIWPEEVPELREVSLRMYRAFEECARILLTALAEYYDLPKGTFADMIEHGNSVYRIIHYPPLDEAMPAGAVRAAAHEDINLITLLIESRGGGLEILTQDGRWTAVDALAGDIIVDSGDMLCRATNGVVPAVTHRVVNPEGDANTSRYSMPFFVHPYSACDLTVMDRFVTPERPPQWPPITAGAYLRQRLEEIGLLKKD